ncbi:chemotaxis protein CheC [Caldichromatium japonicum]|uniref:Chemotaxis protein CheC n=1 Tax=Caldichromatium japonicum TaxID=2699430 RepID=A0A6G7VGR0_9GAMM|nr:chemotaxis protein CheC [Caldichromatium japonicum]
MCELSDLQRDALCELFNLGVGRAAHSLSQMVQDEIQLMAPVIDLVRACEVMQALLGADFKEFSLVTIDFSGSFMAKAILIFPERNALAIVGSLLAPDLTPEEVSEFEQEAMCEIGNVILNACMSAVADEFGITLFGSLPEHYFSDTQAMRLFAEDDERLVLLLRIQLVIDQRRIQGQLVLLLSIDSFQALCNHLDTYLTRLGIA